MVAAPSSASARGNPSDSPNPRPSCPVVVLVAHPQAQHSRVNRALARAVRRRGRVELRDLYALYPGLPDRRRPPSRPAGRRARLVVWQHPVHWYGMPPLLKLWLDEVLTSFGWAYGPAATR